jgi:hypothetical protein
VRIGTWLEAQPVGHLLAAPVHVTGAPELAMEILSPGTRRRDRTIDAISTSARRGCRAERAPLLY